MQLHFIPVLENFQALFRTLERGWCVQTVMSPLPVRDWASGGLKTKVYKDQYLERLSWTWHLAWLSWDLEAGAPICSFSTLTTLDKDLPEPQSFCLSPIYSLPPFLFSSEITAAPLQCVALLQIIRSTPIVRRAPWQPLTSSYWRFIISILNTAPKLQLNTCRHLQTQLMLPSIPNLVLWLSSFMYYWDFYE